MLSTGVAAVCETSGMTAISSSSPDRLENRRTRFRATLVATAMLLFASGVAALPIDLPVAAWCKTHRLPG